MKTRILLLTGMLAVAMAGTMQAQSVTFNTASEKNLTMNFPAKDTDYEGDFKDKLGNATDITVTGTWDNVSAKCLMYAIGTGYITESKKNSTLKTIDMSKMTFVPDGGMLPGHETYIEGSFSFSSAFKNCEALEKVILPEQKMDWDMWLEQIFYKCSKLSEVKNLENMTALTNMYGSFMGCASLHSITLPDNLSKVKGWYGTFNGCPDDYVIYIGEDADLGTMPEEYRAHIYRNGNGIRMTETTEIPAVTYIYNIDGRLLKTVPAEAYSERLSGLQRGIYLVNGKKEAVR